MNGKVRVGKVENGMRYEVIDVIQKMGKLLIICDKSSLCLAARRKCEL